MSKQLTTKKTFFQVNITDIRGKKKACEICKKDFSVLVKEHQCKRCKRAVCYACSQTKAPVYKINVFKQTSEVPHRSCLKCKAESERLKQFIFDNKLVFGRDTLSVRWLQSLKNELKYSEITKEYFDNLNDPQFELKFNKEGTPEQLTYKRYKEADQNLEKILQEYCEAFNYSFQEFFRHVLNKITPETICVSIRNILRAFLNKHSEFGFDNQFILIITFFLCFSSEPVAFILLSKFYDQVYPRQLYYKFIKQNNYDIQKYMILIQQLLENVFQVSATTAQKTQSYLKHDFLRLAFSLSINALTFENTYYLIDSTISNNSFMEFLKAITAICSLKMEEIVKYADVSFEKLQVIILRNVELQDLEEAMKLYETIDKKVQDKIIQFFSKQEEKEGFILDDKYFQNKIIESDQYKELLYRYEKLNEDKDNLQKSIAAKDESYNELLAENEQGRRQYQELKEQFISQQQELFSIKNLPKQTTSQEQQQPSIQAVTYNEESTKQINFLKAQIEELKLKNKLLQEEITQFDQLKNDYISQIQKLQESNRESNKLLSDLAFDNQNLQYELDSQQGRSRTSTRQRVQETKLSYEVLEQKANKLQEMLDQTVKELDEQIIQQAEIKMATIRDKRLIQENSHIQNTLNLQITFLEEQLKNERKLHIEDVQKLKDEVKLQYKKMFESLEIAYSRNDELVHENQQILNKDRLIRDKLNEMNKFVKVLQEDNEKLRVQNDELNEINQMAKKADCDNLLSNYQPLLSQDDPEKQKMAKQLFDKVKDLLKEIQFRTIDQLLKREYIVQLQKKNHQLTKDLEEQQKQLAHIQNKVDSIIQDPNINNTNNGQNSIKLIQQSLANDLSLKAKKLQQNQKEKEDCKIM